MRARRRWRALACRAAPAVLLALAPATLVATPALAGVRHSGGQRAARAVRARVDPALSATGVVQAAPGQAIEGFGASGAWWPTEAAHFPTAVREQIGRMLFGRAGLYLSRYRYNIGGGGVGVTNPYKAPPSFMRPDGSYDWGADPEGTTFLRMAAGFRVPVLVGFVNSAPAPFTSNGRSCGGQLVSAEISAYGQYLAAVASHLAGQGMALRYVSPMNEPDTSQPTCRQEGMSVPVGERAELVNTLAAQLRSVPGSPEVIADESSLVRQLTSELPQWHRAVDQPLAAVAHHTYDFPSVAALDRLAALGVPHWATEICCFDGRGFGYQYDPTMTSGLWLADTIYSDLVVARDSAFDWWVALSPNTGCPPGSRPACLGRVNPVGRNDGLVYFDRNWRTDHNLALYTTKRYWVMAAFSRYVRPGAVLHPVGGLSAGVKAVAFEQDGHWVVVAINDRPARSVELTVRFPSALSRPVRAVVTDAWAELAPLTVHASGRTAAVRLPPRSVVTVEVLGAPAPAATAPAARANRRPSSRRR